MDEYQYINAMFDRILRSGPLPESDSVKLERIRLAYAKAIEDPKALIPSYLHAAIEAAK